MKLSEQTVSLLVSVSTLPCQNSTIVIGMKRWEIRGESIMLTAFEPIRHALRMVRERAAAARVGCTGG